MRITQTRGRSGMATFTALLLVYAGVDGRRTGKSNVCVLQAETRMCMSLEGCLARSHKTF